MPDRRTTRSRDAVIEIDGLTSAGDGLASSVRGTVVVPGTVPGERVRVRLRPGGHGRPAEPASAELLEILRPSPHRVPPRCVHFGACGGCTLQHVDYAEQLRLKRVLLDRIVRAAVPAAPPPRTVIPAVSADRPWNYRQKVHFVFGQAPHGPLVLGHYARGTRHIIPVRECPVHDERGNRLAFALRDRYDRAGIAATSFDVDPPGAPAALRNPPAGGRRASGVLKSIALRVARQTREIAATLVVRANTDKRLRITTQTWLDSPEAPTAFHVNVHDGVDPYVFGRQTARITGPERLREEVAGLSFLVSPTAFFQTNIAAAEILVRLMLEAVPAGARVLDLYAGAGLFALPLARAGCHVTAVEESRAAVADGLASLRLNRLPPERCRFVARPVEAALRGVRAADVVVLDPPRAGCSATVLREVFGRLRPERAIYVSCSPEALARDLRSITSRGYGVEVIQPVDMFPHTGHVETLVTISKRAD